MTGARLVHPGDLARLPHACEHCPLGPQRLPGLDQQREPAGWALAAEREWGACGAAVVREDQVVGYLLISPALNVPVRSPQAGAGVTPGAAVLMSVRVLDEYRGQGVGRELLHAVAVPLVRGRVAALEATGSRGPASCVLPPATWLEAQGFRLVRDTPIRPRWRLDLSATSRWKPDLADVLKRLGRLVPLPSPRPTPPEPAGFDRADRAEDPRVPSYG